MDEIVKNIRDNDELRASFNELTQATFNFNFVGWYEKGLWGDCYVPHAIVRDGKVVANISVNFMDFIVDGVEKHYIQLGTVMTDKAYRNQGLSRKIMEYIIKTYQSKCDGIYLFGNDSVLNFYPLFGFVPGKEYQYTKNIDRMNQETTAVKITMNQEKLEEILKFYGESVCNDRLAFRNNPGLLGFYIAGMCPVYYLPKEDAYVVAGVYHNTLVINQIIAKKVISIKCILEAFGGYNKVQLAFSPLDSSDFVLSEYKEDDCTYFYLGNELTFIMDKKLRFPELSHA